MGEILASALIAQASEIVQDESNVIWETAQALGWLNDAQRAIVSVRPDSSILNHSVTLVPGTKQTITGLRLMAVNRNMGADGSTPGRAIRLVERGIKDDFDPDWHTENAATAIKEWIFDARLPKEYYVSPPVHASTVVQIELSESVNPAEIAITGDTITLDDVYSPSMIEWVLYRFLSRDSEETPNIQRAVAHFQQFFSLLGAKLNPDMAINPKVKAHLE
jgi:hypothetical protein